MSIIGYGEASGQKKMLLEIQRDLKLFPLHCNRQLKALLLKLKKLLLAGESFLTLGMMLVILKIETLFF
ncbi:MAG: hypothetical protein CBE16_00065 [Rhodospirillaceae bacterium TMED256]|nr:MAG: hypothetical protein CBE16_00065 [Rhodospirillaceae bacterium TMED256]